MTDNQYCLGCNQEKPISEFPILWGLKRSNYCKACSRDFEEWEE